MKNYFLILSFLFPFFASGQAASSDACELMIRGKIVDSKTHAALPFASVYLPELKTGLTADGEGDFRLERLCTGKQSITISMVGYKTLAIEINLLRDIRREFALEKEDVELHEIVVEGHVEKERTTLPKDIIEGKTLSNTRGNSLAGSIQSLPGVNMIQTGPSVAKPVIHGLHSNRVLILNNGVRLEGQQWGSEHAPEIDPFVASQISVVKGAAGVRFGSDAIGGVIMVQPKNLPNDPGIGGEINVVGISNGRQGVASGIIEGSLRQLKGVAYRFQTTYKKGGNLRTPDYFLKNTGSREINFSGAVGYHKGNFGADVFFSRFDTKLGIFTGAHVGNITDLRAAINADRPLIKSGFSYEIDRPYQAVNHSLLKLNTHYYFEKAGRLSFIYALQGNSRKEFDAHRPKNDSLASLNRPEVDFQLRTQTGEMIFEHKRAGNFTGSMGITGLRQVNIFVPLTRRLIPNFRTYNGGIFIIERYEKEKFEIEAGIRYDYRWTKTFDRKRANTPVISNTYVFNNVTGAIGGVYHFDQHFALRANIGSAWRAPSINELFFYGRHHSGARFIKGDSTLNSESALNISTTFSAKESGFKIDITPYYNRINDFIYLKPESFINPETNNLEPKFEYTISGVYPSFVYTQTDAEIKGLDISLEATFFKKLTLNSVSSFVRTKDRTTKEFIEYIPSDKFQNSVTYNFKEFLFIKKPSVSMTNIYVAEQTRVPANTDFLAPPPGYSLFNADLNFSIKIAGNNSEFGISANNILNTRYRDYLNSFRYFADEPGRNFTIRMKIPLGKHEQ